MKIKYDEQLIVETDDFQILDGDYGICVRDSAQKAKEIHARGGNVFEVFIPKAAVPLLIKFLELQSVIKND